MKQKIIIAGAMALLLALIVFMAWDLFFTGNEHPENPYAYDLKALKAGDTSQVMYLESRHFDPGFKQLYGITCDKNNRIYVCGENRVAVFDSTGKFQSGFTVEGVAHCITLDEKGQIYLGMQDHLEIYDPSGRLIKKWVSPGDRSVISSVAVSENFVYIADAGFKIVHQYDRSGNFIRKTGEKDPSKNIPGFVIPSPYFDLGMGRNGELWVVNPGRHRFEQYTEEGDLVTSWGLSSMAMEGFCGCCNPSNFAILSDGSFVTSEKGIERIKVYFPDGRFRCVVATPDMFTEGTKGLDLAVDSKDRILVLDPEKNQVRIFVGKN